jgi:Zn finger protein HypA/HybF involved in hydrogenase expression
MMGWGSGGGYGVASLCGCISAACTAANLVSDQKTAKGVVSDIFNWYEQTALPSEVSQKMANEMKFTVEKYKSTKIFKATTANSPLCHISVERFCKTNGVSSGSKERSERCARLTADTAHFLVTQLNKAADAKYKKEFAMSAAATSCRECHAKGVEMDKGGWSRGKMDCQPCHSRNINVSEGHYIGFENKEDFD